MMKRITPVSLAGLLWFLTGCPAIETPTPPTEEELQQAYQNAVTDAQQADPSEVSNDLTAVVEWNSNLVWEGQPGEQQVLVVTWTSWTGYDDQIDQSMVTTRDIWVTAVPDIQEFCEAEAVAPEDLTLRLEQLLGLPPDSGKDRFVELWVDPADLFRPSPDPEVTDHEAELDFPSVTDYLSVSDAYVQWFNDLLDTSYGEDGYPWTRLGYTYDWGDSESEVGLSEFVIRAGATVQVHSVTATEDYCNWWD